MGTYNVHAGHSLVCRGASGFLDEVNEDRKVKNKVIELLRKEGHTVYDCTDDVGDERGNLANIVEKCNKHEVDIDISIHLNAGGGTGPEVWLYSDKLNDVAARISANGITVETYNASVSETNPESMYINQSTVNHEMRKANRAQCRKDRDEFEELAYSIQDEIISKVATAKED